MVIGTLFVPVRLLRIMKIVSVLFFCFFILPISAQSTYFLDFLWDANGITLQNSEKVKVAVKQNQRSYISSQNIYFDITKNGKQVFWSSQPHPRHVHVEYADESGSLHRQDSVLEIAEFTIRVPAGFQADTIRFFTANTNMQGKIKNGTSFSDLPSLKLVEEISISLKTE